MTNLYNERAVLVRPHIRIWEGNRVDREAGNEIAEMKNSKRNVWRAYKTVLADETRQPIIRAGAALRDWVKQETLPWTWAGVGLLPNTNFLHFMEGWRSRKEDFNNAVKYIVDYWPQHVVVGKAQLGDGADEYEYPTVDEVRTMYSADVSVFAVPSAQDFRADIGEDEVARVREDIEKEVQSQMVAGTHFLFEQMADTVGKIVTRLKEVEQDPGNAKVVGTIRDPLIGNLRGLVDRLGRLNVTGNPDIEKMKLRLQQSLVVHEAKELRQDDKLRASVLVEAESIAKDLASIFGAA